MIDYHTHDGVSTPRLYPKDLLGFPIFSAIPTHKAEEGTIILAVDSGNYYIYAMIERVWRGVQLTL